ncbi:hypothetical protein C3D70_13025 [Cronobacter sakazakii]|uniref:hypothetical protein n=1 Tax=Cronobacter sakazakii TaxID=28141 RepID=UPI000CF17226|nr:hypothetical protein [Cronobacter sakazakii]PPX83815.1 hypothetical protein C3D70_13025 [Cronobacter sakazakii]
MANTDSNYQIVYRGECLEHFSPGGWVFFQRLKEYGGGYWMGQTFEDCFVFGIERPVSLNEGLRYLMFVSMVANEPDFDDDFTLT